MSAGFPAPRDWRRDVVGVGGVVALLGIWLAVSPLVLGYGSSDASWNPVVCGVAATGVAAGQVISRARAAMPGLLLMAIGTWLFASGLWLADSSQASWNAWGAGAALFFLGSVSTAATQRAGRT